MVHELDLVCGHLYNSQLISTSTQFSSTPSTIFEPKYHTQLGNFPKFSPEKFKVVHFYWKLALKVYWRCWFRIQTLIFEIPTPKSIFGQIWAQKVKNVCFCLKIGTHGISRMLILIPTLGFWIFNSKFLFGQTWTKKSQSCLLCFKIDRHGIFWKLILILALVFLIPKSKFIIGQN